jgi:hypothetical protein
MVVIYKYVCNQCLSPLTLWVRIPLRRDVPNTALCDKVYQWLAAGLWFSPGTPFSSTNKNNHHDIAKILLKVALNTITLTLTPFPLWSFASCWIVGIFFYYLIICLMGQNPFCWHYCRITHMNYNEWVSDVCLTLNGWFRSYIMSRASHILMRWWWCPLFCTSPTCLVRFFNSASSLK